MSLKRFVENKLEDVQNKMLKKMEDNESSMDIDITLNNSSLCEDVDCSLVYDSILQTFSITIEKHRDEGNRYICVSDQHVGIISKLLIAVEKLAARYSAKPSPCLIDVPFQVSSGEIGELITVVSLKENAYKRGSFDVDIRKCFIKEGNKYQYTTEGVRLGRSLISALREKLSFYNSIIKTVTEKTKEIITSTMAWVISKEILELSDPKQTCHGCTIDHPSQKQHMDVGGCLAEEQPAWTELCDQYWSAAKSIVTNEFVQDLAQRAVHSLPALQKSFITGVITTEQISETEVRDMVERKEELEDTDFFKMLMEIY
ncbi:hypothetical protein ACF0H5_000088 [Mactra antiquata]